jgi:Zn-dependent peptidase ImmA (M78 family)/DNA-binding transcriptional regulator YiaG
VNDAPRTLHSGGGTGGERDAASATRLESVRALFSPDRLRLARQLAKLRKNEVAIGVGVTPTAVSQWESGASTPSADVLARLALKLAVPVEFFVKTPNVAAHDGSAAHFRSLRATSQLERSQALAFGEVLWHVANGISRWVELPAVELPEHPLGSDATPAEVEKAAALTRLDLGLGDDPIAHVVRLAESRGIIAAVTPQRLSDRVDAFSHWYSSRPVIILSSAKGDAVRSRFDAAHEFGHLVMHHDAEPGSQLVERQAHLFASCLLAPPEQLAPLLPKRADWAALAEVKAKFGISLKSAAFAARRIGVWGESTYKTAMIQYNTNGWNSREPYNLGPAERPAMLGKAWSLMGSHDITRHELAEASGVPEAMIEEVLSSASETPPMRLDL